VRRAQPPHDPPSEAKMKRFNLHRFEDETGVSGTGVVSEGVMFTDGKCAMRWLTERTSVALYDSIDDLEYIHGHDGKTVVVWID